MELTCQKALFSLDDSVHYLNCAYMAPLMKSVEEAGIKGLLSKRNPQYVGAEHFFNDLVLLRQSLAKLIHAQNSNQVAIVASASYGLSTAAANITCRKGQNVIVVKDEFPSNYYVWKRFCEERSLNLITVSPNENAPDRAADWNRKIIEAIDENTAVVALENVHWMDGTYFNLEAISSQIQRYQGYLIVDGTQSVGMLDLDVEALKIDALVCAGYKWLMGPYSIGFAYFSQRLCNGKPIEENWVNREGSHVFSELTNYTDVYREGALKYDVGETANFILVPMFLAAVNQLLDWGVQNMHNYVSELTKPFIHVIREANLIEQNTAAFSPHLFSVKMPEYMDVKKLSEAFAQRKVFTSVRGNFLRISPQVYNTAADLNILQQLLMNALR